MKIVSNTGPIIGLAKIGLLFILNQLSSEVSIPPMVQKELLGKMGEEFEQIDKALKEFIHVKDFNPMSPWSCRFSCAICFLQQCPFE